MKFSKKLIAVTTASLILTACDYVGDMEATYAEKYDCPDGLELLPYNPETFPYASYGSRYMYKKAASAKNTVRKSVLKRVAENQQKISIIIRDFDVSHPDFENFQEEAFNSLTEGSLSSWISSYTANSEWMARRSDYPTYGCGNVSTPTLGTAMGSHGYPKEIAALSTVPDYILAIPNGVAQGYAWYGEFSNCSQDPELNPLGLKVMRGFAADLCSDLSDSWTANTTTKTCNKICKAHQWSNVVYTTPGMVKQNLVFKGNDMLSAKIQRNRTACDNAYFDQWFSDVAGINKRTNTALILDQDPSNSRNFQIDYNWNNGGFFPLDSISADGQYTWVSPKSASDQFGAQSLSIFCPPYNYKYAASQKDFLGSNTKDLCDAWMAAGGPKTGAAAPTAAMAVPTIGLRHLRNYGFTMMGYTTFKYKKGAGETFKISGDDDIWVFVDGVLVADLGGVHLPAAGTADMDFLAANSHGCHAGDPLKDSCSIKLDVDGSWKDGSWHHLHFFYADRQTDGSNLSIRSSLSELGESNYGDLSIKSFAAKTDAKGNQTVNVLLNTELDAETHNRISKLGASNPVFLVLRTKKDIASGAVITNIYGYYVASISDPKDKGDTGTQYQMTGVLMDAYGNVVETGIIANDKVTFNILYDEEIARDTELRASYASTIGDDVWSLMLSWSSILSFPIKSVSGAIVTAFPSTINDWPIATHTSEGKASLYQYYSSVEPGSIKADAAPGDFVCQIPY